jgi:hypothetical protein
MFNGLFDFSKKRTLKESIGFFVFYICLFLGATGFASLLGR